MVVLNQISYHQYEGKEKQELSPINNISRPLLSPITKNTQVFFWEYSGTTFSPSRWQSIYYLAVRSLSECMRQVLRPGALGRPKGIGWRGRWEGGLGWGIHVTPWLIHVNVWQNPLKCCEVVSLQLIKINEKKERNAGGIMSLQHGGCDTTQIISEEQIPICKWLSKCNLYIAIGQRKVLWSRPEIMWESITECKLWKIWFI